MKYKVVMERFWGLKETVAIYANLQDAINGLQVKKAAALKAYPEAVFTIITAKGL